MVFRQIKNRASACVTDLKHKSLSFCLECVYVLAGQLVHMQGHRAFFIALLVVLRHVHVALCVACVISHPHGHRSACNSQLP